ncbi:MAG TPA: lysylphosphatidylglycerol synthase domain-containing protein [Flavitalea sp.]|nr:lysylphosphatidylglycerol synthase domain-containing protein [Flavitalea sp.]
MQIQSRADWESSVVEAWKSFSTSGTKQILWVFLLMLVNWGLEARKWQLAIGQIQKISFFTAYQAILCGTTLGFFTPNRMGEYFGRIWYIDEGKRIPAISLTIVCSIAQLLITLSGGIAGLFFIRAHLVSTDPDSGSLVFWLKIVQYTALFAFVILLLLYFRLSRLVRYLERITIIGKWIAYIRVLDNFNATHLLRILSLSGLRYLVFLLQYFIVFQVFSVGINWWQSFWSISVVFLILAIVPTIAVISELGVRWKASVELVRLFSNNMIGIFASSLVIWTINLVIPALIGSLLILRIKFFTNVKMNVNQDL